VRTIPNPARHTEVTGVLGVVMDQMPSLAALEPRTPAMPMVDRVVGHRLAEVSDEQTERQSAGVP
jgi:hypothetical protein